MKLIVGHDSNASRKIRVRVDTNALDAAVTEAVEDLLGGDRIPVHRTDSDPEITALLDPEGVRVLRLPGR